MTLPVIPEGNMPNVTTIRPAPREVPAKVEALKAQRYRPQQPTLNQEVERIFLKLWEGEGFRDLMSAYSDEEAVEGARTADDHVATMQVREYARAHNVETVKTRKLTVVTRSLR